MTEHMLQLHTMTEHMLQLHTMTEHMLQLHTMTEHMLQFSAKIPSNNYLRNYTTFDFNTWVERVKTVAWVCLTCVGK